MRDNIIWHDDIEQGSNAWHRLRSTRVTGTSSHMLLVNGRKSEDGLGEAAITLAYQIAGNIITGTTPEEKWAGYAADRGKELEPVARREFERKYYMNVNTCGFVEMSKFAGVSLDGVVFGADSIEAIVEFKCLEAKNHLKVLDGVKLKDEDKYYSQVQWGLFVTGAPIAYRVFYHPDYLCTLEVKEVEVDVKMHEKFLVNYEKFKSRVEGILERHGTKLAYA